jgi:hypothetical protein
VACVITTQSRGPPWKHGIQASYHPARRSLILVVSYQMQSALELHDSKIASVEQSGSSLVFHFSSAYIHQSEGDPGVSSGEGFVQPALLEFLGASWSDGLPSQPEVISNAEIVVNGEVFSLIPCNLQLDSPVQAKFIFVSGRTLTISAASASLKLTGTPHWVESYVGN